MANADSNDVIMELEHGIVHIRLFPDVAPNTVARFKELVSSGFYDKVVFHRVIEGFMAQTGDPTGTGMGGSGKKQKAEFSKVKHKRGIVSMARAMDPDSADSQFFIMLDDSPHLDGQYTVFGEVTQGMEYVDMIKKGLPTENGMVEDPDIILRMFMTEETK
ncbi:MAG: peptidylprolyl isomerase [Alphaproteobacteria bacterium]|nr:peptidylprolyl isomerase [Alphaproteobacteria bacterium]OJV12117.1 MAG: peptidylprolyl isomerase [Alphaproteobacteria bacterium 33-17]